MADLTPDHPAVDAAERAATRWLEDRELEADLDGTVYMLNAALPHLTAASEENIARLRDTPVGRALMAEAWADCVDEARDLGWLHGPARDDVSSRNPYRESTS